MLDLLRYSHISSILSLFSTSFRDLRKPKAKRKENANIDKEKLVKDDALRRKILGLDGDLMTLQVERNVDFVQRKRADVPFSPKDQESVESFLQVHFSQSLLDIFYCNFFVCDIVSTI